MASWASGPVYEFHPGTDIGKGAVMLSVPHAGRAYAPALLERSRLPSDRVMKLEDRYADRLIDGLLAQGYAALVARLPRAAIDLNRDPRDIDLKMIADLPRHQPVIQTTKQRAGLGLFPRSLPRDGGLWRGAMTWAEANSRITMGHGAYHQRLEEVLLQRAAHHGQIMLVDVHSMPPLSAPQDGGRRADIVIGDLYGVSAASRCSEIALAVVEAHGLTGALNHPYAGSYVLERHGKPMKGRHAIQVEVSRDLYLDDDLVELGPGLSAIQKMLMDMVMRLERALNNGEIRCASNDDGNWACAAE